MTEMHDHGGAAFPVTLPSGASGMTLRDWFAGQALAALPHIGCGSDLRFAELAADAYGLADAMIAARKEPQA